MEHLSEFEFLDPVYRTRQFSVPSDPKSGQAQQKTIQCRWCAKPTESTASLALKWCEECRASYMMSANRYFCHVPYVWSAQRFFEYWQQAIDGCTTTSRDRTFAQYVCDRLGLDSEMAIASVAAIKPVPIQIGELALEHKLLSPHELRWILNFQLSMRPHRRALFGEIAIRLGIWTPSLLPPLLATQAERARGIVPAMARLLGIKPDRVLEVEQSFFGLYATRFGESAPWPVTELLAA